MATIEDAIYARLTGVGAVTDLVSTRIYPVKKDTGTKVTWPFVTFTTVLREPVRAMGSDPGMSSSLVRFDVWAKDSGAFSSARNISVALCGALQRWSGTSAGIVVDACFLDSDEDIPDPEPGVFHRVLDFDFRWFE